MEILGNVGELQLKFENELRTVHNSKEGFVELFFREKITNTQKDDVISWVVRNGWKHASFSPVAYWKGNVVLIVHDYKLETMKWDDFRSKQSHASPYPGYW